MSPEKVRRRPGRPLGSVTLTHEKIARIVAFIRAGAFDHAAAAAVGISPRTFREWIARGEGRGPRPPTPMLEELAEQVRAARAQARISAEARVFREQPAYWLARAARSREDAEGWTEPVLRPEDVPLSKRPVEELTDEELDRVCDEMVKDLAAEGGLYSPPCSRPRCRCEYHVPLSERSYR